MNEIHEIRWVETTGLNHCGDEVDRLKKLCGKI
jgi:hypothetical protein